MQRIKPFIPPVRWVFVDPDTEYVYGPYQSREEMLSRVKAYRAQNRLPEIEMLETVIENYLCGLPENRGSCEPNKDPRLERSFGQYIKGGVTLLKNYFFGKENIVPLIVAEKRASICALCPENQIPPEYRNAKDKFRKLTDKIAVASRGDLKTSFDEELATCIVCTCPLKAKVWYKVEDTDAEHQRRYPNHCWQKMRKVA